MCFDGHPRSGVLPGEVSIMESMGKRQPRPRRSFTPEFKDEIVELCRRGELLRGSGRQGLRPDRDRCGCGPARPRSTRVSLTGRPPVNARNRASFVQAHQQVSGALGRPFGGDAAGDAGDVHPPGVVLDEEQDEQAAQEDGVDVKNVCRPDPGGLDLQELTQERSARWAAGSTLARCKISHTVQAATFQPRLSSSPWIRRYPHPSFSRARRSTKARSASGLDGRPGRRCG